MRGRWLALLIFAVAAGPACAPHSTNDRSRLGRSALPTRTTGDARPSIAIVARDGDGRGAVAMVVATTGIAAERGPLVGVALGALVEARMSAHGVTDVTIVGGWEGWRMRALVASPAAAATVIEAARAALLAPIVPGEPALGAVARKVGALNRRPLAGPPPEVARCIGEADASMGDAPPGAGDLEAWRHAAHGLGRVAIATAGDSALADAAASALAKAPAWPAATPIRQPAWPAGNAPAFVYDASGEIAPGGARVFVTAWTATAERAVAAAAALGDARGPLASRLGALDAPARVRSVVATVHVDGGCVATTIDLDARDLGVDGPARIATAGALARQEVAVEIADSLAPTNLGRSLAASAADPREAAERAAWWSLSGRRAGAHDDELLTALTVGVAATRDGAENGMAVRANAVRAELDRATLAWHAMMVESRTLLERGQGEAWVLLASTCGTQAESAGDAGVGAAVATASAAQAQALAGSEAHAEPFVASDGLGVLVHGPAREGESPERHLRRLGDIAARAFAADALDRDGATHARTALLVRAITSDANVLGALGNALAPAHASWIDPMGTFFGLASATEDAMANRASAIRTGPLRVAVVANVDAAQADAAVRAVDRWVARRPGESRACPPIPSVSPRPGTYAVDLTLGAPSQAVVAVPLPASDEVSQAAARWLAAILDGPDGMLAHAFGASPPADAELARMWGAMVLGTPRAPALAIRIVARDASLDAAIAQTRALLERLRQGGLRDEDRARAAASLARHHLAAMLDPAARAIQLWRGEAPSPSPSIEALRAFAAATLRDDALVIIAARPPRAAPRFDPRAKPRG